MREPSRLSRREALIGSILLPVAAGLSISANTSNAQQAPVNTKLLIAYFSRTGNTRVIAGQIRRALGADLFEIQPAEPYPEDYEETVAQATRERESGFEPALAALAPNMDSYETIFLDFPIWGMSAPPVIRSFLSEHDLSAKTLVPFITHGGYGLGQSLDVVAEHAPQAQFLEGFSMEADQERRTLEQVTGWLGGLQMPT